jgi:uncharacterized RDD family membrane protein YckC
MAERVAASIPRRLAERARTNASDGLEGVLGARILAYGIDSLLVLIFAVAFVGAATLNLLLQTDGGFTDVSDSALWQFVYICLAAIPAWLVVALALLVKRGQTVGQYIMGLGVLRQDGGNPNLVQALLRLAALDPLAFHPVLGLFWAVAGFVALSKDTSGIAFMLCIGMAILSIVVAPLTALVTSAADGGRRGLHDRVSGLTVVRLG